MCACSEYIFWLFVVYSLQWWKIDTRGLAVFSFYLLPDKRIRGKKKKEKRNGGGGGKKKTKRLTGGESLDTGPDENSKEKKKRIEASCKWETAHFDIEWIERSIGGKEFVGLSVEKKKRTKKEIHHWHESFFLLHDSIGRSYLFRFSFRFILFYLIVIFFFFSYQTYMDDKEHLYPCINVSRI